MPSPIDLQSVIEDSLTDAISEPEVEAPIESTSEQTGEEVTSEDPSDKTVVDSPSKAEQESSEVSSPAAKTATTTEEEDEFAKTHGLPPQLPGARENRIPYSRVKKIAANHAKAEIEKAKKAWESEKSPLAAKVAELEPKLAEYETKFTQFTQVMDTNPKEFLNYLSTKPAYKEFFEFINKAVQVMQSQPQGQAQSQTSAPAADPAAEPMPQPDYKMEDGTMVYSMEGLQKLQDWQGRQIESRLAKTYEQRLNERVSQVEKQYAPIRQRFEAEQQLQQIVPQIQKQIEEARTWPLFTDNEDEITKALQADVNLSLEGAYRKIVIPKLQANRDEMRTGILKEIQGKAPSTAVTRAAAVKPAGQGQPTTGPRSLTDIIEAQVREAGLL
jgi:hypothetical protein